MREHAIRGLLPHSLRRPLFAALATVYPALDGAPRWLRARNTFHELSLDAASAYLNNVACLPDLLRKNVVSDRFKSDLQGYATRAMFDDLMRQIPKNEPLLQAQFTDLKTWLPGRMLVKVDRASMAYGLEVRNPFLDHDLMQWALSLPDALKCAGGAYKVVLRKSVEPLLPAALLNRPKQGFGVPLCAWLRGPLKQTMEAALAAPALLDTGWFDRSALSRLATEHSAGRSDHSAPIWALMVLGVFLKRAEF